MLFIGDGGMLMTLGDLETLVRARLPVCVVVMNDHAYGAERHLLDISGKPNCLAKFPDTSFAAVAQALGIKAVTVRSVNDLTENLPDLRPEAGPLLLDCKIRPDVRARWIEEVAKA
jgi:thiamine pyrophosphate-dependent acetolactate synthase large subunit-like protein